MNQPVFESSAGPILKECLELSTTRGASYSDSWSLENQVSTLTTATLDRFGITLEPEQIRLLQLASLADVKDSRIVAGGPFKRDSVADGINYRAAYCTLREEYEADDVRWAAGPTPTPASNPAQVRTVTHNINVNIPVGGSMIAQTDLERYINESMKRGFGDDPGLTAV